MSTIDIREQATDIKYIVFAEGKRTGDYFANRIDLTGENGVFYIDEAGGSGDSLRCHKDDIDNMILALKRTKELLSK